jgi:short-subunit dehydrogenase
MQLQPLGIGVSVLCPGFVRTRIHESGRARQGRYGGQGEVDPGVGATQREAAENVLHGIDPEIVGARVVEAVKAGELYIFTHPATRDFVEARYQTIRSAFDAAAASPVLKSVKEWAPFSPVMPQPPK